jgi:hypothetical protein
VIGVIPKADETPIVEEFFELFKTPWEFYHPGRRYDVVLATADDIPDVETTLLVVYGSGTKSIDACHGIAARSRARGGGVHYQQTLLPVYGGLLTFEQKSPAQAGVAADSGTASLRLQSGDFCILRIGYDLFQEIRFLLTAGQPVEHAHIPTLDIHISMLREWILNAGIPLLEIPPAPSGHSFAVCLTHDIDFVGMRNHKFDHTMWGFLYRSTVGAIRNFFRQRISFTQLFETWRAALSLPFVYLGWAKDFWDPFDWYLRVEKNLPATYFLIPYKKQAGQQIPGRNTSRRATAYDITDLPQWTATLLKEGCEIGVHGIDSWHSVEKGRDELARVAAVNSERKIGIRMHWLLGDQNTFRVLEEAGYDYDTSVGYNETIGYRSGTTQAYRPLGAQALLELPMHIQDGALFFPQRLDLSEPDAWERCGGLIDNAKKLGGALTLLWHDRSHGPERFWGDFYVRLVQALKSLDAWFGSAAQVVGWFRKRREVRFEQVEAADGRSQIRLRYDGEAILPSLKVRVYRPSQGANDLESRGKTTSTFVEVPWGGETSDELERLLRKGSEYSAKPLRAESAAPDNGFWERKGQSTRSLR